MAAVVPKARSAAAAAAAAAAVAGLRNSDQARKKMMDLFATAPPPPPAPTPSSTTKTERKVTEKEALEAVEKYGIHIDPALLPAAAAFLNPESAASAAREVEFVRRMCDSKTEAVDVKLEGFTAHDLDQTTREKYATGKEATYDADGNRLTAATAPQSQWKDSEVFDRIVLELVRRGKDATSHLEKSMIHGRHIRAIIEKQVAPRVFVQLKSMIGEAQRNEAAKTAEDKARKEKAKAEEKAKQEAEAKKAEAVKQAEMAAAKAENVRLIVEAKQKKDAEAAEAAATAKEEEEEEGSEPAAAVTGPTPVATPAPAPSSSSPPSNPPASPARAPSPAMSEEKRKKQQKKKKQEKAERIPTKLDALVGRTVVGVDEDKDEEDGVRCYTLILDDRSTLRAMRDAEGLCHGVFDHQPPPSASVAAPEAEKEADEEGDEDGEDVDSEEERQFTQAEDEAEDAAEEARDKAEEAQEKAEFKKAVKAARKTQRETQIVAETYRSTHFFYCCKVAEDTNAGERCWCAVDLRSDAEVAAEPFSEAVYLRVAGRKTWCFEGEKEIGVDCFCDVCRGRDAEENEDTTNELLDECVRVIRWAAKVKEWQQSKEGSESKYCCSLMHQARSEGKAATQVSKCVCALVNELVDDRETRPMHAIVGFGHYCDCSDCHEDERNNGEREPHRLFERIRRLMVCKWRADCLKDNGHLPENYCCQAMEDADEEIDLHGVQPADHKSVEEAYWKGITDEDSICHCADTRVLVEGKHTRCLDNETGECYCDACCKVRDQEEKERKEAKQEARRKKKPATSPSSPAKTPTRLPPPEGTPSSPGKRKPHKPSALPPSPGKEKEDKKKPPASPAAAAAAAAPAAKPPVEKKEDKEKKQTPVASPAKAPAPSPKKKKAAAKAKSALGITKTRKRKPAASKKKKPQPKNKRQKQPPVGAATTDLPASMLATDPAPTPNDEETESDSDKEEEEEEED